MNIYTRCVRGITLIAAFTAADVPAHAQKSWRAVLTGSQEIPANASPASGVVELFLAGNMLTVEESWSGLIGGPAAAAHIHCCVTPGSNVGVAVPFTGFPSAISGTYSRIFDLSSSSVYTSAFITTFGGGTVAGAESALIAGLDAGNAYANIHDAVFPGGEIRGDLVAVATPEPSSVLLLASGLVAFASVGWARRRTA